MKKLLLFFLILLSGFIGFSQTAVNFTANDCAGSSHTLFTELDAGKVIVLTWVMPCGACISVASSAAAKAQSFASSNPGRVKFYLVDDYANSSCSTLNSWASTNSISPDASFSNAAIKMTDYGTAGMQKTIVLGGTSHTVYYNVVGAVSASALQTAITNALNATTGIAENNNVNMGLNVFPSPAFSNTKVNYTLNITSEVNIDVVNLLGEKVSSVYLGTQSAGKQEYQVNCESLKEGVYFIRLKAGEAIQTTKITVIR